RGDDHNRERPMKPAKQYTHNGLSGCVSQAIARETGTLVGVYHAGQAGMDNDPLTPWFTVCEEHHYLVGHPSLRLARQWAPAPSEWWERCWMLARQGVKILPDIAIPRHASFAANQDQYGIGDHGEAPGVKSECLLCAKPLVVATSKVVVLTDDLG